VNSKHDTRPDGSPCHDPYLRCAFYGAAQTAVGVKHACILAHSPQGCELLVGTAFSWQQADYIETKSLCTKLCEDEIVHGGEQTLARTIEEARTFDVPVVFVLTACGPEIVGDDIRAVCEDMAGLVPFRLVPIECAGFRGSQYDGIDIALETILGRLIEGEGLRAGPAPPRLARLRPMRVLLVPGTKAAESRTPWSWSPPTPTATPLGKATWPGPGRPFSTWG